jgi:hypothetical protein
VARRGSTEAARQNDQYSQILVYGRLF